MVERSPKFFSTIVVGAILGGGPSRDGGERKPAFSRAGHPGTISTGGIYRNLLIDPASKYTAAIQYVLIWCVRLIVFFTAASSLLAESASAQPPKILRKENV